MDPAESASAGMDWWRLAELGIPLVVTVALAWIAIAVETRRARNDRREAWRYERTRVAVESLIEQMTDIIELAERFTALDGPANEREVRELMAAAKGLTQLMVSKQLPQNIRSTVDAASKEFPDTPLGLSLDVSWGW